MKSPGTLIVFWRASPPEPLEDIYNAANVRVFETKLLPAFGLFGSVHLKTDFSVAK